MKKLAIPLSLVLLAVLSAPAAATGVYVFGGVGAAGYAEVQSDFDDAVAVAAPAAGASDKTADAYKLGVGYRFNETWGVEGGLIGGGRFRRSVISGAGTMTRDMEVSAAYLTGVVFFPVGEDSDFYLRGGLASWRLSRDYRLNGGASRLYEDSGSNLTIGLGFAATFTKGASVFIDYDFLATGMKAGGADEDASFGIFNVGIKGVF